MYNYVLQLHPYSSELPFAKYFFIASALLFLFVQESSLLVKWLIPWRCSFEKVHCTVSIYRCCLYCISLKIRSFLFYCFLWNPCM